MGRYRIAQQEAFAPFAGLHMAPSDFQLDFAFLAAMLKGLSAIAMSQREH
jgi:hypothetical protein